MSNRTTIGTSTRTFSCAALVPFAILFAILLAVGAYVLLSNVSKEHINQGDCNVDDRLYILISDNAESWLRTLNNSRSESIQFTTTDGDRRHVRSYEMHDGEIGFFVSTQESWPARPEGSKGYIYATSLSNIPQGWLDYYSFIKLSDNIYCYSSK